MEQREILFQIWDKEKKRMSKPLPVFHSFVEWSDGDIEMPTDLAITKNERFVFLQYTGLKDKNGKEIYEGDILRSLPTMKLDETIIISKVEFDQRRGMWVANAVKYDEKEYLFEAVKPHHETEIIGNIYENPSLLNQ